jgi:hypothetical protein
MMPINGPTEGRRTRKSRRFVSQVDHWRHFRDFNAKVIGQPHLPIAKVGRAGLSSDG